MPIKGWRITGLVAALITVYIAVVYGRYGLTEESVRMVVRNTARCSVALFLLAFTASSLQALLRRNWTAWLLRNRRYIGVSFAVSHGFHLLAIITLASAYPEPFFSNRGWVEFIGGGLAYAVILAMTITSFKPPRQWLGQRRWVALHTVGGYYIWALFANSYLPRALQDGFYVPFAAAVAGALLLRLARNARKKRLRQDKDQSAVEQNA